MVAPRRAGRMTAPTVGQFDIEAGDRGWTSDGPQIGRAHHEQHDGEDREEGPRHSLDDSSVSAGSAESAFILAERSFVAGRPLTRRRQGQRTRG